MFASDLYDEPDGPASVDWDAAACRDGTGAMTELFFSDQIPDIRAAKAICLGCILVEPCLAGAIERREPWGVWGGELFANGKILTQKRKRGRPPKNRPVESIQLTA
jgi:WhiB family redox-sensing transcriptional regulator